MESRLEALSEQNMSKALDMCDRFVSPGLYTLQMLEAIAGDPGHDFYLVREGDAYLGYFYAQRLKARDIGQVPGFHYDLIAPLCHPEEEIGLFRSTGLEPPCRGGGLSDALVRHFQSSYQEDHGLSLILVAAWRQGTFVPAEKLLLRSGFHYYCDLIRPWADSLDLNCSYCRQASCVCDAVVYYKKKDQ